MSKKPSKRRKKTPTQSTVNLNHLLGESGSDSSTSSSSSPVRKANSSATPLPHNNLDALMMTSQLPSDIETDPEDDGFHTVKSNKAPAAKTKSAAATQSAPASTGQRGTAKNPNASTKLGKTKPIFVKSNYETINNFLKSANLPSRPLLKIINGQLITIQAPDLCCKEMILAKLREQKYQFHTFTEREMRKPAFFLKGYFKTTSEDLLETLNELGLPVTGVTIIPSKADHAVYRVQFGSNDINVATLNHHHKSIDFLIVRWESIDKSKRRSVQCGKCKAWGHTSANCGYHYRCIKCTNDHKPGECKRTTKTNTPEDSVQCVNCKGDHPANSTTCPAYIKYVHRITGAPDQSPAVHSPGTQQPPPVSQPAPPARRYHQQPPAKQRSAAKRLQSSTEHQQPAAKHPQKPKAAQTVEIQPRVTPRDRASYAETLARPQTQVVDGSIKLVSSFNSSASVPPSSVDPLLEGMIKTLQSQFESMLKALNESFLSMCQSLVDLHGSTQN
jgi:hypothetical protein